MSAEQIETIYQEREQTRQKLEPLLTDKQNEAALGLDANGPHVSRGPDEVKPQVDAPALDKPQEKERKAEKSRSKAKDKGREMGLGL